jgi:Fe(3+) dicitrate transport protein
VIAGNTTVDIAGKRLPYAPRHSLLAGIEKSFDFGLTLRGEAQYVSKVYTDFENIEETGNRGDKGPIPAYTLFNASALYTIDDRWRVGVVAKNIADEIYIGSRLHSNPGQPEANLSSGIIPGARRQINLSVAYTFGN